MDSKGKLARIALTSYSSNVYEPSDDTFLLADTVVDLSKTWAKGWPRIALEVGSGSGYVITSLALTLQAAGMMTPLLATDCNPAAAAATQATLRAHGVENYADIIVTDLTRGLLPRIAGCIDLLLFNPPYVPTPDAELRRGGIAAAWAGGYRGRSVIDRLLPDVPRLLSATGEMMMVAVPDNDPQDILSMMERQGLEGRLAAERSADEEHLQIVHFKRLR